MRWLLAYSKRPESSDTALRPSVPSSLTLPGDDDEFHDTASPYYRIDRVRVHTGTSSSGIGPEHT